MKSISLRMIPASLVFVPFIIGCGAEPITGDTPVNPILEVRSDLAPKAYRLNEDGFHSSTAAGATVDSLEVTGATILASDLQLQGFDKNSIDQVGMLRRGQFLLVFNPDYPNYINNVEVLAGTYSQAAFEVHAPKGPIDSLVGTDDRYSEFVTFGPSNSVIIHGNTYKNGVKLPFVFTSALVMDGQFLFSPQLSLEEGMLHKLHLRLISQTAFGAGSAVLDPADARNRDMIENNLRSALGVFRL
jgi:hypothetical protein